MRFNYVVTLRRGNEKLIDRISLGLCTFAALAFLLTQIREVHFDAVLTVGALLTTVLLLFDRPGREGYPRKRLRNTLFVAGVFWWAMPAMQWISLFYFAAAFMESLAKKPLEIGFSDHIIQVNGFPRKTYGWEAFNNVLLKDGLLTLDFKNNRLLQKETIEDEEDDADEDEFNAYCLERLMLSNQPA
jgi:hypothetical protein